ncbi:carbohydrate ABC transporter permease [Bosea lathyri]|uniref:Carbohydrate ABC transporter membrane protein 1, CUT1 family n=1 Tax=Bosea lathyri TaxID=1036778 RepID=A0A1H6CA23_9HYPH|nr:sugar ABC transporter permease [Bosea lathyri]SEG69607.1 carbohydrate ABC transporter membrane protein 1, CUT1 family [Bosea lathyri]
MPGSPSALLYVFLALPILYLIGFVGFPIAYNLMMSVQEVNLGNITEFIRPFVGLDNYRTVLADESFQKVLVNTLLFVGCNVVAQVGIGLGVALFFAQDFPGAGFMRGLLLCSWMLPALVVGALWKWIFATEYGVANSVLSALHLIGSPIHWLSDPAVALTSVTLANIWFGMPFSMILIAAALTAIPKEHYEAASLDGAGSAARFWYITLPALKPALLAVACLVTIYTMRAFDLIFAMTQGGPLDASNVLPLLSYQFSFKQFDFGVGSAMGSFAFLIVFGVALLYVRTLKQETAS